MQYDEAAAKRLETVCLGPDVVAQREDTLSRLPMSEGERVLDIGSGPGFLASDLACATCPAGKVVGEDISEQMVERATARANKSWLSYSVADAAALPFADNRFDVVVSTQAAEYMSGINAFCSEAHWRAAAAGRAPPDMER